MDSDINKPSSETTPSESTAPVSAPTDAPSVQAQLDSLHHLLVSVLVLVIVVSGTLWIFLMRQVKDTSRALDEIRPQATNIIAQYQKTGPVMDDFIRRLQDYGRGHPDFAPIMAKYGLNQRPPGSTSAPTGSTLPGVAPKK